MSQLAYQQTGDKDLTVLQNRWIPVLNPVIACPLIQGHQIDGVLLTTGANVINHRLGDKLRGYLIVLKSNNSLIFDTQLTNQTPDLTLQLNASGNVTVSLWVY